MSAYELTIVFPKESKEVTKKIAAYLKAAKAEVKSKDDWGVKPLAYPIKKHKDAHYYYYELEIDPADVKTLETKIKLDEVLLRHLLVRVK